MYIESEVAQLCLTLCNPMDCSLPGSSVHGILQYSCLDYEQDHAWDLPNWGIEPGSPALQADSTMSHQRSLKKVKVAQLCPTLCNLMDCSPPGSSVHGILQPRILEWVGILFSRGSSQPGDQTQVSAFQADSLASEPPGKPIYFPSLFQKGGWLHRYN